MRSHRHGSGSGRRLVPAGLVLLAAVLVLATASVAVAAPLQTAKTADMPTMAAWLNPKQPTQHSTVKAWCRVLDSTGEAYSDIPVRFTWRVDGKRTVVTKHTDATGRASCAYKLGAVRVGHRDAVTVLPYGADWSLKRVIWFTPTAD